MTTPRSRPYIAAYLILLNQGKILLSRRFNTGWQDGKFSLVAGHFDEHETAKEAIIREALEEAGIELSQDDLTVSYVLHRWGKDREYIDVYLTSKKWTGLIENREPEKCGELAWFSLDALPDSLIPHIRFVLQQIEANEHYGEFGWEKSTSETFKT
ncbi:MAG: NUDIX domain-containing protein [Parachlamydiaceae bacterium]